MKLISSYSFIKSKVMYRLSLTVALVSFFITSYAKNIEQWGIFELALRGSSKGNPFTQVQLSAEFTFENEKYNVKGFYDGQGIYKIRFMPNKPGSWSYKTISNSKSLNGKKGKFSCVTALAENNGMVKVANKFHFQYSNGKPFYPIGTTAYGCMQQTDSLFNQTLWSLKNAPFNKVRIVFFPHTPSGKNPILYPYEKDQSGNWDFSRFNPEYFSLYEQRIMEFQKLGIEVDLCVFHPYDLNTWGFDKMDKDEQYLYLDYINARFGSIRSIWWSMANEFDLMKNRSMEDWDGYFQFFKNNDPYQHLRSIHNAGTWYDHSRDWVTHVSCQTESWWNGPHLREKYGKPIVIDEFCYEGNGAARITALSGDEMIHRFWLLTIAGCYATHGEAFYQANNIQFFRQGGTFLGNSIEGISFLKKVFEELPGPLEPVWSNWKYNRILAKYKDEYYLYYLGVYQNTIWQFDELPEDLKFKAEIIDTKEMTITPFNEVITKGTKINLPGKPYQAMILKKVIE